MVFGDGRLSVEAQPAGSLDLLVLDAFSAKAMPLHRLTLDAFRNCVAALAPDGLLVVNLSTHTVRLGAVLARRAGALGLERACCAGIDRCATPTR